MMTLNIRFSEMASFHLALGSLTWRAYFCVQVHHIIW